MSTSTGSPFLSKLFMRWLPGLLLLLLAGRHFWLVYSYSINIPYQDDILDYLQFINLVEAAGSIEDTLRAWFAFYNDHRTTASRAQVYLAYLVQGEVDFRAQALLGNVALLLVLFLFYLAVRGEQQRWLILLVPALLMLTIRPFPIVAWGQPTLAYFYVYFYAFACLFALHRVTPPRFVLAVILAVLASFTFASGLLVWFFGLVFLLHQSFVNGRLPPGYAVAWLLCAAALVFVWLSGFAPATVSLPTENKVEALRVFDPNVLDDPTVLQILWRYLSFGLVSLGRAITDSSVLLAGALGLCMLGLLVYLTVRHFRDDDIRLVLCAWFTVAAVAVLTVGRALFASPEFIIDSNHRYSFLSVMAISTLFMLVQTKSAATRVPALCAMLLLAGVFHVWTYTSFEPRLQQWVDKRYRQYNRGWFRLFTFPEEVTEGVVREALDAGRITLPCRPAPGCEEAGPGGD